MPVLENTPMEEEEVMEVPATKKAKTSDAVEAVCPADAPSADAATHSAEDSAASSDKVLRQVLRFAKLSEHATAPKRGSAAAAGFDLYAAEDKTIDAGKRELVKTDIQIQVPDGCYGRVAPRSGLAAKHGIDVGAGVIDKDYRGNVKVLLFNFGDSSFAVAKGDRVAQLVLEKISEAELEEAESLSETDRGEGGFGSTGKD